MTAPRYYCPPPALRPEHIRTIAGVRLVDGAGPEGKGGVCYGGAFDADLPWQPTSEGWLVCLQGVTPRDLRRVNAIPGPLVDGWLVPQILDGEAPIVGYFDAEGFQVPEPLREIVARLQAMLDYVGPVTKAMADLASDLLVVNHHVSIHELGLMRVLTGPRVRTIIDCASTGAAQAIVEQLRESGGLAPAASG